MVRLRLRELLGERDWTPYRLAKETGLTVPAAYRLVREDGRFARLEAQTLERLCEAFGVQPGELLELVPDAKHGATPRAPKPKKRAP